MCIRTIQLITALLFSVLSVTLDRAHYIVNEGSEVIIVLSPGLIASEPYTVNIVTSPGTAEGGIKAVLLLQIHVPWYLPCSVHENYPTPPTFHYLVLVFRNHLVYSYIS